jgi:hypothetical protein
MAEIETSDRPDPQDFHDPSPEPSSDPDLAILGDALQEHGVRRVVVRYQGYGDEGAIEEIELEPADAPLPDWLEASLQDVAEDYCPDGYENNDGGYGCLTVYPFDGLAELEHCARYEDSQALDTQAATLPSRLRRRLLRLGVRRVAAHFDGYGDSGQIGGFEVEPEAVALGDDLERALEDFLLGRLPEGWEINEGGHGDFTVDVPAARVEVDAYFRVEKDSDTEVTRWRWRQ